MEAKIRTSSKTDDILFRFPVFLFRFFVIFVIFVVFLFFRVRVLTFLHCIFFLADPLCLFLFPFEPSFTLSTGRLL